MYQKGDQVLLDGCNIKTYHPTAKLVPKCHRPFLIQRILLPIDCQLTLPEQWGVHDVFHVDLLTPYRETEFHGANYNQPPPDLVREEEQYEVEQVQDEHIYGHWKKKQYLVKWKGYPGSDNQWVDARDMENAQELIAEFHTLNSKLSSHIKRTTGHLPNHHSPTLPSTLSSTLRHMSHALNNLHGTSVHKENTDPLPILPCLSTPVPVQDQLCVQNQTPHIVHVSTNGTGYKVGITFPHPDKPSDDERNDSNQETLRPPHQKFHVLIPPFNHLAEWVWWSPSQTTLMLTTPSSPPLPKSTTPSITVKSMLATLKRSSESLELCDTEAHPVKMMKQQLLLHNLTKSDNWNLNLPLAHHLPITSLF